MMGYTREIDWIHHHQHFLFKNLKKTMKMTWLHMFFGLFFIPANGRAKSGITVLIHELFHFWKRLLHKSWTFSENNLTPEELMTFLFLVVLTCQRGKQMTQIQNVIWLKIDKQPWDHSINIWSRIYIISISSIQLQNWGHTKFSSSCKLS